MSFFRKSLLDTRSSAQKEEDFQLYQQMMLPFGMRQKKAISDLLDAAPKKGSKEQMLFLVYASKEKYFTSQRAGACRIKCLQAAYDCLKRYHFASKENLAYIFCVAISDLQAESMEHYPTVSDIYDMMNRVFPVRFNKPFLEEIP